jgi:hypothetical protein
MYFIVLLLLVGSQQLSLALDRSFYCRRTQEKSTVEADEEGILSGFAVIVIWTPDFPT